MILRSNSKENLSFKIVSESRCKLNRNQQSLAATAAYNRKTFKVRVLPATDADNNSLIETNKLLVALWNLALAQCMKWLEGDEQGKKTPVTYYTLCSWLTVLNGNAKKDGVQPMACVLQRELLRRLAGSFSSYFALRKKGDTRAQLPRTKEVERSFVAMTWPDKSFKMLSDGNNRFLTAILSRGLEVRLNFVRTYIDTVLADLPAGYKIAQITLTQKDGEYWASIVCNIPRPELKQSGSVIALDLGSGDIAIVRSDGTQILIPARRPDKLWRKRVIGVERRVVKCVKGSCSWKRRMRARRIMLNKSRYQHRDHQRKFAHWLCTNARGATIVIGKMRTRLGLSKSESGTPDQHWGAQNTGYLFQLLTFIREKAGQYGLTVLEFKDPERQGSLSDPGAKFRAAQHLLKQGCEARGIDYPKEFQTLTHVPFPQ